MHTTYTKMIAGLQKSLGKYILITKRAKTMPFFSFFGFFGFFGRKFQNFFGFRRKKNFRKNGNSTCNLILGKKNKKYTSNSVYLQIVPYRIIIWYNLRIFHNIQEAITCLFIMRFLITVYGKKALTIYFKIGVFVIINIIKNMRLWKFLLTHCYTHYIRQDVKL